MALLTFRSAAWAQTPAAAPSPASLPIGSPVVIVSDENVDPRVRPGSEFRAHLRDPIEVGQTLVATAGTSARLIVTSRETGKDGMPSLRIAITGLNLGLAGTLPVRPTTPTVERIAYGMVIPATTLAALRFEEGKLRVAVPLPFTLSNEPPNGGYTPAPLRTASPIINSGRNRRRPSPKPTAPPSGAASPLPSDAPSPSASGPMPGSSPVPTAGISPAPLPAPT